mmetsp:Transcript_14258/g.20440  ORF Transcript_14258/g.20440 Transcript_14258/m.20440 type:complete len:327 (-) Transcript_14258:1596-2576(-)
MPSLQNSAGAGKAAKFVSADPLAPMANPFDGLDDDQGGYQKALADNVNKRLMKGIEDIKGKYANGTNERDDPDRAPTGAAYQAKQQAILQKQILMEKENQHKVDICNMRSAKEQAKHLAAENDENDCCDSDDEFDKLLDEVEKDPEILRIRQQRLEEIRQTQVKRAENLAKGHGQYRLIHQDEFLPECTSSRWVAVHFFHNDFQRCKIMHHHLQIVAIEHVECKFLKIDADKAPFFVNKLKVKTLPTLIVFQDGLVVDRLVGFESLTDDPSEPDKWHTGKLQQWLSNTGAITYTAPREEVLEEMKRLGLVEKGSIWSKNNMFDEDD